VLVSEMISELIDEDDWKPLADLSPLKLDQGPDQRSSIFYRFDPKLANINSKRKLDTNDQAPTQPRDVRLTNIFKQPSQLALRPGNLSQKKSSLTENLLEENSELKEEDSDQTDHQEEVFKDPQSPTSNDSQIPIFTKSQYEDQLKAHKQELADKLKQIKSQMSADLKSLRQKQKQVLHKSIVLNEKFAPIAPEKEFALKIKSNFCENNYLKYSEENCKKLHDLRDSIANYEVLYDQLVSNKEKLIPEQNTLKTLKEQLDALNVQKSSLETNHRKIESKLKVAEQELSSFKINLDSEMKSEEQKCTNDFLNLEKQLKRKEFEFESNNENLARSKEDLESTKKHYDNFQ